METLFFYAKLWVSIQGERSMSSVEKKTFATEAAEVMEPNNAKVEIVNVGGNRAVSYTHLTLPTKA